MIRNYNAGSFERRPEVNFNYRIITRPTTAPISVSQLQDHLQLYGDDSFNDYLQALLITGIELINTLTDGFVGDTTVEAYNGSLNDFSLPHFDVSSITSLQYYDLDNVLQTVPTTDYYLDNTGGQFPAVRFTTGYVAPQVHPGRSNPVVVRYVSSITTEASQDGGILEQDIAHALMIICEDLFRTRGSTVSHVSNPTRFTAEVLLSRYRRTRW